MDELKFPDGTKREDAVDELIDDEQFKEMVLKQFNYCLLYTSPSPRDYAASRMPSSA